MKANHSKWIPIAAFLLAVGMSMFAGPATSRLLARDPGSSTGDCTPPAPPGGTVTDSTCSPFTTSTNYFDPANPPANMPPLKAGEAAVTFCHMDFTWGGDFNQTTCTNSDGSCVAIAYATEIDANLNNSAEIWLPNGAGKLLTAHENGHAEIDQSACAASCTKLKTDVTNAPKVGAAQKGPDCTTAIASANANLKGLLDAWLKQVGDTDKSKLQAASDAYDTATGSGTKGNQAKEAKIQATNVSNAINPPPPKK